MQSITLLPDEILYNPVLFAFHQRVELICGATPEPKPWLQNVVIERFGIGEMHPNQQEYKAVHTFTVVGAGLDKNVVGCLYMHGNENESTHDIFCSIRNEGDCPMFHICEII